MESLTTARRSTWRKALPSPGEVTQTAGHRDAPASLVSFGSPPGVTARRRGGSPDPALGGPELPCAPAGTCPWAAAPGFATGRGGWDCAAGQWCQALPARPGGPRGGALGRLPEARFIQVLEPERRPSDRKAELQGPWALGSSTGFGARRTRRVDPGSSTTEMKSLSVGQGHAKVSQCLTQPLSGAVSALWKGRRPLRVCADLEWGVESLAQGLAQSAGWTNHRLQRKMGGGTHIGSPVPRWPCLQCSRSCLF